MKPAQFEYHAPRSLGEALDLLAEYRDDARILAGGQSLVPAMNFRLARPARLVDINRFEELDYIKVEDGALCIGALARHRAFERPLAEGPLAKLLPTVAGHIATLPIRVRGTFAGSLAHADPAAEWCAVAATLDAEMVVRSRDSSRSVPAADFFQGAFTTAVGPGELLAEVRLPLLEPAWSCGFAEFSRRAGDFAIAMAVVALRWDGDLIAEARIGIGGAADRPVRASEAEALLVGVGADAFEAAAEAASRGLRPLEDIHASAAYKRDLVRVMTRRALVMAAP